MSNLVESLERWLGYLASVDRAPTLNPPATEAEIAEAEEWWGFEFVDEVRELYRYANGTDRNGNWFLPSFLHLMPLESVCSIDAIDHMIFGAQYQFVEDRSGPYWPLPIVWDPEIERFIYVVCDEVGKGSVLSRGIEAFWEARSLAELFDRMADYGRRGIFATEERGVHFPYTEVEGRLWHHTEAMTPDLRSHDWRWEPVEWKSEEVWDRDLRKLLARHR